MEVGRLLRGDRVRIRALEKSDLERLQEFVNDDEIHLLADDDAFVPQSKEQVEKLFFEELGKSDEEIGPFGIETDGKLIGTCGLHHVDQRSRVCSFGINISDHNYLGKGYGREAVKLLVDYAFRHRNFRKVWLTVYADNERAIRSYRALGFVDEGLQKEQVYNEGVYKDWLIMGLLRRDYDPSLGD
jgi:RimJ/RimL family protein N-acetyltransferase